LSLLFRKLHYFAVSANFNKKQAKLLCVFEPIDYVSSRISADIKDFNRKIEIKSGKVYEKILTPIKGQDIDRLILPIN
jgi:hypothetical protein